MSSDRSATSVDKSAAAGFSIKVEFSAVVDSATFLELCVDVEHRPLANIRKLVALRDAAEAAIAIEVVRARRNTLSWRKYGVTWARIGEALGVTPQAAQKRYGE